MQHAAFMQVAHAASDVMSNVEHGLDACESRAETAVRGDTPRQDCMLQQQEGAASQTSERSAGLAARGAAFMQAGCSRWGRHALTRLHAAEQGGQPQRPCTGRH